MAIDWNSIRDLVELDPKVTYLNTGTSGLVSKIVHQQAIKLRSELHHNPTSYVWRTNGDRLWNSRERFAKHIQTTPDRIIFFTNISHAINTFCLSMAERSDAAFSPEETEILVTDHEYGAMQRAWKRVADRKGWSIVSATLLIRSEDPEDYIQAIVSAITSKTRVLFLSHVLYTTGHVLPLEEIVKRARAKKPNLILFVDGAHAAGMLPLDIERLDVDFYAANLHKWFMAPVGAAFLYVRHGREPLLEPWQVSWGYGEGTGPDRHERNEFGSTPWIHQFEMEGTRDFTPWLLLDHCCDFFEHIGYNALTERHRELTSYARSRLSDLPGLSLVTPANFQLRGGLTSFEIPQQLDPTSIRNALGGDRPVEVNFIDHPQSVQVGRYLRVSTHVYNTEAEIDRLACVLPNAMGH